MAMTHTAVIAVVVQSMALTRTAVIATVRDQSKFQREVQVSRDKLLEEFEAENEQLLADLRRSRANLAALHEQTANEARARARAEGEIAGDVLHAQVTELKARLAAQSDELGAAQNRALCAEVHVEESELLAQDESVLRAAAEAKLEMLVTDIEQEESRMLEEIELLKVTIEDKDGAHRLTVQNMAMEIELLHENEEVLNLKIVKMNRGSTQNRAPGIKGKVDTDSLASELASKAKTAEAKLATELEQAKEALAAAKQLHATAAQVAEKAAKKAAAENKAFGDEVSALKGELGSLETTISTLKEERIALQALLNKAEAAVFAKDLERTTSADAAAAFKATVAGATQRASKRLSAAQADLKCKESEVASLKPRIKELTTELNTTIVASKKVDSELSAAQAEATLLKAKVGALESELAATKASLKSTKDAAAANGQSADETTAALKAARATEAKLTSDLEQSKAVLVDSVKAGKSLAATLETKVGSLVSELTATKLSLQSTADAAAAKGKSADATAIALKSAKAAEATLTSDLAAATDALASASEAAQKVQASAAKAAKRSGEENGKLATELTSTRAKLEAVTIAVSNHHHHLQSFAKANAELKESLAEALANGVAKAAEAHAAAEASARMIASMEERIAKLTEKSAASDVEVAKLKAKAEGAHAATVDAAFTAVLATKEVESLQVQLTKANTDVQSANAKLETMKKTVSANTELLKTAEKTRDAATETATQLSIDQSKAASVLTSAEMELCLMKELVSDLQSDLSAARELTAAAETSLKAREESAAAEKEKKRIAEAKIEFAKAAAAAAKASSLAAAKAEDERRAAIEQTNESEIKSVETGWKKEPVAAIVPCVPTETSYLRGPLLHPDGSVTRDMRPRVWHGVVDVQQLDVHTQELSKPTLEVCTDGNSLPLHNLCILIERLFYHGFVTTPDFFSFSKRRDPWDFLTVALKSEGIADAVNASKSVTTSVGRFRLFVRWALVQQRLAEYVQIAFAAQPVAMKFYDQAALLLRSETMMTVERALYALTGTFSFHPEVYVSAKDNSFSLDADWPCPTSRLVHRDI